MTDPCTQKDKIDRLEKAMFGDKELELEGIVKQVKDIHEVLLAGNAIQKTVIWIFGGATAIVGLVLGILEIMRELNRK